MTRIVSRDEQSAARFARPTCTPAEEHVADQLVCTCIGVMHIVDMYASRDITSIIIAVKDNP